MIKHWRLFDGITDTQISQLYASGISVDVEDNSSEFVFPKVGRIQCVKRQDVYISTTNEKQETFLFLMFDTDKLRLVGKEYDNNHAWLDSG